MQDRTRWLLYEMAVTTLAFVAGVSLLVAVYSHLWLGADRVGDAALVFADAVALEESRTETLRVGGAAVTAVALGLLALLAPGYAGFADDPRAELRTAIAVGFVVALAGGVLALVAPGLVAEALGLTLVAYGLLALVAGSAHLAVTTLC